MRNRHDETRKPKGNIEPSPNDIAVFHLLTRHRYLRTNYIAALLNRKNTRNFRGRLRELYDHAYLDRPHLKEQWAYLGRRKSLIYELSPKGRRALEELGLYQPDPLTVLHFGRISPREWPHAVMISDIMAGIEIGAQQIGATLISYGTILENAPVKSVRIPVDSTDPRLRHIKYFAPDAIFGIKSGNSVSYYALEADAATEAIHTNHDFTKTTYLRKIIQYEWFLKKRVYESHFALPHIYILNITRNEPWMERIKAELLKATGPSKRMLFSHHPFIKDFRAPVPDGSIFTRPYTRVGHEPYYLVR